MKFMSFVWSILLLLFYSLTCSAELPLHTQLGVSYGSANYHFNGDPCCGAAWEHQPESHLSVYDFNITWSKERMFLTLDRSIEEGVGTGSIGVGGGDIAANSSDKATVNVYDDGFADKTILLGYFLNSNVSIFTGYYINELTIGAKISSTLNSATEYKNSTLFYRGPLLGVSYNYRFKPVVVGTWFYIGKGQSTLPYSTEIFDGSVTKSYLGELSADADVTQIGAQLMYPFNIKHLIKFSIIQKYASYYYEGQNIGFQSDLPGFSTKLRTITFGYVYSF